ncbi:hypothetical protein Pst134EA_030268 [Puccinia striiformis f. sp. tritici]|nr:hypothetical protein Pst134EA_030268 [Puccinia striiformis f. sp. tritici]KAH9446347.1 hypothetical protein Pst134EA_030268 [Puccinia striiformis f. sp. tritici]
MYLKIVEVGLFSSGWLGPYNVKYRELRLVCMVAAVFIFRDFERSSNASFLGTAVCARLQIHKALTVGELSEHQIGRLSALLSSLPTTPPTNHKVAESDGIAAPSTLDFDSGPIPQPQLLTIAEDPLQRLLIESDLRREVRANIAHHRAIGSYKGKRHALGFPVNGQRTHTNAKTARKLNKVERRAYSTSSAEDR